MQVTYMNWVGCIYILGTQTHKEIEVMDLRESKGKCIEGLEGKGKRNDIIIF